MELKPGRVFDRYTVEGVIGEGGMAVVYRVRHSQLGTPHALKVLSMTSRSIRERLLQEGRVQAALRHPNIVAVTDVVEVDGQPGLVMEFIDGPALDTLIESHPLTLEQADHLAQGILAGVQAAHEAGLIHRDLKPGNIMLARVGDSLVPKVMDFGLAKIVTGNKDDSGHNTRTGSTMGTPSYMSPEQVRDSKNVDHRTDVFALGAILYELVTAQRAFIGDDLFEIFSAVANGNFVPPRERCPELPDRMRDAIIGALRVDKDERIPDVATLVEVWAGRQTLDATTGAEAVAKPFDADLLAKAASLSSSHSLPGAGVSAPSGGEATWGVDEAAAEAMIGGGLQQAVAGGTAVPEAFDASLAPEQPSAETLAIGDTTRKEPGRTSVSLAPEGAGLAVLGLGGLALAAGGLFAVVLVGLGLWVAMSDSPDLTVPVQTTTIETPEPSEAPDPAIAEAVDQAATPEAPTPQQTTTRPPEPSAPAEPRMDLDAEEAALAEAEAAEDEQGGLEDYFEPAAQPAEAAPTEAAPAEATEATEAPAEATEAPAETTTDGTPRAPDGRPIPVALTSGTADSREDALVRLENDPDATALIAWSLSNDSDNRVRRKAWRVIRARFRKGTGDFDEHQKVVGWVVRNGPKSLRLEAIAELGARGNDVGMLLPAVRSDDSQLATEAVKVMPDVLARDPDGKERLARALRLRRSRTTDPKLRRQLEDLIRDL